MHDRINVLLVENDLDFVFLIKKMLENDEMIEFMAHAESKDAGIVLAQELMPDIVLMDLNLSENELDGIEAAKTIRLLTCAKVLLLTSFEQPEIMIKASKKAFASGYVFKSQCSALADTIRKTAYSNTPQEQFIKELLLQDLTAAERNVVNNLTGQSSSLSSAYKTIANQKTPIFKKLGLSSTKELLHIFTNW